MGKTSFSASYRQQKSHTFSEVSSPISPVGSENWRLKRCSLLLLSVHFFPSSFPYPCSKRSGTTKRPSPLFLPCLSRYGWQVKQKKGRNGHLLLFSCKSMAAKQLDPSSEERETGEEAIWPASSTVVSVLYVSVLIEVDRSCIL